MFDRFLVPYYFFWPIAFITFILIFFIPTTPKIKITNNELNITALVPLNNQTDRNANLLFNIYNKDNISQECKNIIINTKDQHEIKLVKKLNLTIKIIIMILFGLTVSNMILVYIMVKAGGCYDEDFGGYCQTWEHTFSCSFDDEITKQPFYMYSIWIIICFGIIIISILSISYSYVFKNKMKDYCKYELNKDYTFKNFKVSIIFLLIIISLFVVEILLCVYSICFAIFAMMRQNKSNNKTENDTKDPTKQ